MQKSSRGAVDAMGAVDAAGIVGAVGAVDAVGTVGAVAWGSYAGPSDAASDLSTLYS